MEGVQHLPAHQQQAFMKEMEHMQLKDSLTYVLRSAARLSGITTFSYRTYNAGAS
jgi:hypothetical protein